MLAADPAMSGDGFGCCKRSSKLSFVEPLLLSFTLKYLPTMNLIFHLKHPLRFPYSLDRMLSAWTTKIYGVPRYQYKTFFDSRT